MKLESNLEGLGMSCKKNKVKVSDICLVTSSKRIFASEYVDSGIPFLRSKEVIERATNQDSTDTLFISNERFNEIEMKFGAPKQGDILLASIGANMGISYYVDTDEKFYFKDGNVTWFSNFTTKIDSKYLYYCLNEPHIKATMLNRAIGSAQKALTIESLRNLEIPLVPLDEQKKISNVIYYLDEKIKNNLKTNKTLEEMAQTLFKRWFIDFEFPNEEGEPYKSSGGKMVESELGMIPKEWSINKLYEFADIQKGLSYKGKHLVDEGTAMINLGSIKPGGGYRKENLKFYNGDFKERHIVKPGDIIIANTDMTQDRVILGSPLIVPNLQSKEIIFTHHLFAFKDVKISKLFLYYYLKSPSFRERAESYANGTTVLALSKDAVINIDFVKPDITIINQFDKVILPILNQIDINNEEINTLEKLRDTLLPKLMSGEIRVNDLEEIES